MKEKQTKPKVKLLVTVLLLFIGTAFSTAQTITGNVSAEDGPLPGASVIVKGTTNGTTTDFDGNYSINAGADNTLIFSYLGYKTIEIAIGGQSTVNASMSIDAGQLDEVVVVGYGTQKKKNLTGSVGIADAERLENRPITSAGQGLQGVVPNLNIAIRNGDPTQTADFNIRGFESINGGSPLILVDGVPMDLERINPNDIASVSVLKDASAAAVYGARGAFGVILVETKKGRVGKTTINFSTQQSYAKPIFHIDPVTDPLTLVNFINEATVRTSGQPRYDDEFVAGAQRYSENPTFENAWDVVNGNLRFYGDNNYNKRAIAQFTPQKTYDFSISGATEKASYYVSFGYLSKDGYINNTEANEKFKRYNVLMKTDYKVNDWVSLDSKIVYNAQNSDKPHFYNWDVNINTVARVTSLTPVEFPDLPFYQTPGDRSEYEPLIGKYFGTALPYFEDGGRDTFVTGDTWFTQGVTLTPVSGLKIRSDFSYNAYTRNRKEVASKIEIVSTDLNADPILTNGLSGNDYIEEQNDRNEYYVFNAYAEYEFNADRADKNHFLKAMIGFNQEWGHRRYFEARAQTLITPLVTNINATTGAQTTGGRESDVSLRGGFYRLNYIFKDRYLFEVNGRYDGTSRFPTDDRFGFFPSFSAGWVISEEGFLQGADWLNQLKIRGSWGRLGNQSVEDNNGNDIFYPYISSLNSGTSPYILSSGRTPFVGPGGLVSDQLTWETVESSNVGLDFTMFNNKLDVSADYFTRDTKDMLMSVGLPSLLGTSAPATNAADLRTKGWELSVTWRDTFGKNGKWGLNLALADSQSEITKFINPSGALPTNDIFYEGQQIGEIWGYETVGIFQSDDAVAAAPDQSPIGNNWAAGDIQYADLNNDGKIDRGSGTLEDSGDYKVIGNTTARYTFGINPDVKYKNWSMNMFFQGLFRDYLPSNGNWNAFYPNNANLVEKYYLTDSWSPTNRDAYFAAPLIGTSDKRNILPQSRYVQDASYIRLKNLTVAYDIPNDVLDNLGMNKFQLYLSGQNLWEYTTMRKPLDPESIFTVTQEYYLQRIFTFGVNVSF